MEVTQKGHFSFNQHEIPWETGFCERLVLFCWIWFLFFKKKSTGLSSKVFIIYMGNISYFPYIRKCTVVSRSQTFGFQRPVIYIQKFFDFLSDKIYEQNKQTWHLLSLSCYRRTQYKKRKKDNFRIKDSLSKKI